MKIRVLVGPSHFELEVTGHMDNLGNTRKVTRIFDSSQFDGNEVNWKWQHDFQIEYINLNETCRNWFTQSLWTGSDSNWEFWVILEKWLGFWFSQSLWTGSDSIENFG